MHITQTGEFQEETVIRRESEGHKHGDSRLTQ